ncbi:MAG: winged helix-turn-helix transcriptional regulator [Thiogranum sp.]|nr:winged helix-turn-helix transcriptional regulator [Thiogranum sp.]
MQLIATQPENLFQALADQTRLRIIRVLAATAEEACLCELVDSLQEPAYKLSRHLKILRQAGLLSSQKDGRWVYHQVVSEPEYLDALYATVRVLPDPDRIYQADLARFKERMCLREGGRCRVGILSDALKAEAK